MSEIHRTNNNNSTTSTNKNGSTTIKTTTAATCTPTNGNGQSSRPPPLVTDVSFNLTRTPTIITTNTTLLSTPSSSSSASILSHNNLSLQRSAPTNSTLISDQMNEDYLVQPNTSYNHHRHQSHYQHRQQHGHNHHYQSDGHHHHPRVTLISNDEDEDGIYENYNIDYDQDYDQFYDKPSTINSNRHVQYIIDHHSQSTPLNNNNNGPRIHEIVINEGVDHRNGFILDQDDIGDDDDVSGGLANDLSQQQQQQQQQQQEPLEYFYEDDDEIEDGNAIIGDNIAIIDPSAMFQQQYQVNHPEMDILSDANTYGLAAFLPQQQQILQRHLSGVNGGVGTIAAGVVGIPGGSIYGNPYCLHTIYEESENESSLQTLSSLTSSTMHSGHFEQNAMDVSQASAAADYQMTSRQSTKLEHKTNHAQGKLSPVKNELTQQYLVKESLKKSARVTNDHDNTSDRHSIATNGKEYAEDYDYYDYDEEEPVDIPIQNGNGTSCISASGRGSSMLDDTLSSKLERYFTSGLLEPLSSISPSNNNNNNNLTMNSDQGKGFNSKEKANRATINNDDHGIDPNGTSIATATIVVNGGNALVAAITEEQNKNFWNKFNEIECLSNFLEKMMISDDELAAVAAATTITYINDNNDLPLGLQQQQRQLMSAHFDRLSHLFKIDMKRFLIEMIAFLQSLSNDGKTLANQYNDDRWSDLKEMMGEKKGGAENEHLKPSLSKVIVERLLQNGRLSSISLQHNLIQWIIDIYSLTNIDHLLFDHRLWSDSIPMTERLLYHNQQMMRMISDHCQSQTVQNNNNNNNSNNDKMVYTSSSSVKPSTILNNQSSVPSKTTTTGGKTIIKVTINGKLLASPVTVTSTNNNNRRINSNGTSITILNTETTTSTTSTTTKQTTIAKTAPKPPSAPTSKIIETARKIQNPEYRTILQINDSSNSKEYEPEKIKDNVEKNQHQPQQQQQLDTDYDENQEEIEKDSSSSNSHANNKLSKFLRVSNPLNRSFLAKISSSTPKDNLNGKQPELPGEVSVADWANEHDINDGNDEDDDDVRNSSSMIKNESNPKRCCSNEQIYVPNKIPTSRPTTNGATTNGNKNMSTENGRVNSKVPKTINNNSSNQQQQQTTTHRNSFKNFSIYEMFRNPFKSSKKRKKSTVDSSASTSAMPPIPNGIKNENHNSKSLSEPNLNGGAMNKRQNQSTNHNNSRKDLDLSIRNGSGKNHPNHRYPQQHHHYSSMNSSQNSITSLEPLEQQNLHHRQQQHPLHNCFLDNEPIDDDGEYGEDIDEDDIMILHSKSTPQLQMMGSMAQIKHLSSMDHHRSWTGSWDRRIHQNAKNNRHRITGQEAVADIESNRNNNKSNELKHCGNTNGNGNNIKIRLQRSLSGSNTTSLTFSAFQRPKSCIISNQKTAAAATTPSSSLHQQKSESDDCCLNDVNGGGAGGGGGDFSLLANTDNNTSIIKHQYSSISSSQQHLRSHNSTTTNFTSNKSQQQQVVNNNNNNKSSSSSSSSSGLFRNNSSRNNLTNISSSSSSLLGNNNIPISSSIPSNAYKTAFKNHFDNPDIADSNNKNFKDKCNNQTMALIGKICLSIYYEIKLNSLTITIFRCHLNMIKKHKNDLYVKVYVMSDQSLSNNFLLEKSFKKKTKIHKAVKVETSSGPIYEVEYNEILRFSGKWRDFNAGQLSVSLWNNDTFGRNTLIGQAMIRFTEHEVYLNSIQTRVWHELFEQSKIKYPSVFVKGSLFLAIRYEESTSSNDSNVIGSKQSSQPRIDNYEQPINNINKENMITGDLQVLIKNADDLNLNQYNINGLSYCKLSLKPERNKEDQHKTKPINMGQCPRWNEKFTFHNLTRKDLNNKELEIKIIWQDKSTKTYLGSLRLTNHEDATQEERNLWKQVIERPNLWAYGNIPLRH